VRYGKRKLAGCTLQYVLKCSICGMAFYHEQELKEHGLVVHNFSKEESSLLRKASDQEKARKRTRGPYRKSHAA
jgi:hypothetical protein